tara:strand:+ start:24 stop:137 length:114 start_codon:yes stop_codon:yes gene_type:complete
MVDMNILIEIFLSFTYIQPPCPVLPLKEEIKWQNQNG